MEEEEGRWIRGSIINICEYECISCIGIRGGNLYGRDPSDSEEIIENYVIVYEGRAFSFSWRRRFSPHEETDVFFFFFFKRIKSEATISINNIRRARVSNMLLDGQSRRA